MATNESIVVSTSDHTIPHTHIHIDPRTRTSSVRYTRRRIRSLTICTHEWVLPIPISARSVVWSTAGRTFAIVFEPLGWTPRNALRRIHAHYNYASVHLAFLSSQSMCGVWTMCGFILIYEWPLPNPQLAPWRKCTDHRCSQLEACCVHFMSCHATRVFRIVIQISAHHELQLKCMRYHSKAMTISFRCTSVTHAFFVRTHVKHIGKYKKWYSKAKRIGSGRIICLLVFQVVLIRTPEPPPIESECALTVRTCTCVNRASNRGCLFIWNVLQTNEHDARQNVTPIQWTYVFLDTLTHIHTHGDTQKRVKWWWANHIIPASIIRKTTRNQNAHKRSALEENASGCVDGFVEMDVHSSSSNRSHNCTAVHVQLSSIWRTSPHCHYFKCPVIWYMLST